MATAESILDFVLLAIPAFCFGYPFVMAIYWVSGGVLYVWLRGRHEPRPENPPALWDYPGVSVLVPRKPG